MSDLAIRPVTAADYSTWLSLWQAYQRFYKTDIPEAVTQVTWQRMLDEAEPINAALAWRDGVAAWRLVWSTTSITARAGPLKIPAICKTCWWTMRLAGQAWAAS